MLGRALLAATLALAAPASGGTAPVTPAAPAWSLYYGYGTGLFGGTTLDVDASGRFDLVASSAVRFPRSERLGSLSPAELQTFAQLVAAARPSTWSKGYDGERLCIEHYSSLRLSQARGVAPGTVAVTWTCGLNGVPADLRALIVALRAQITALRPDAMLDTYPAGEAIPVARHDALQLVSRDRTRSVSIAADGTIISRRRTGVALYAVADCPVRALGVVDAPTLAKLHALQTPTSEVYYATSRETSAIFEQAMADCAVPAGFGYAAPEYAVPSGTRWIVQASRFDTSDVVGVAVDNAGRSFARRKNGEPVRGTVGRDTLRALEQLVANARDERWPNRYGGADACEQSLQITHVAVNGARTNGPSINGPCDLAAAPADAAALIAYVGERVIPELTRPR